MKGDFIELINDNKPVLVDFHAEWCSPCKAQAPIIQQVSKEVNSKVRIIKIDIDKNRAIAQRYNVKSVPTLALFKAGKIVWRDLGVQTKAKLIEIIKQNT
ncbi:thioredoxin [Maribacter sp. ACAM166]|uniref:thioredoxin n=1 Tax=Maribacter sp. ACAM166 TaxID=2508996 RepID=UPI001485952B|nr:thioredoxin [Maribacter sp. ACAM166]